jgi:methanogenic corrinoid protein MtbC1
MGNASRGMDPDLVGRAASVFSAKATVLDPSTLQALAGDVLRHVAGRAQSTRQAASASPPDSRLSEFCATLLGPGHELPLRFLEARKAEGASFDALCLDYLGAAAVWMGRAWDEDRLSFLEVTVAVGRLYALMRAMRDPMQPVGPASGTPRRALFASVPGEDHRLGITLAADMFRTGGWDVELLTGCDHDTLVATAERLRPPVIGLSLSSEDRLAALARLVVALRLVASGSILAVAPPATMDDAAVAAVIDTDLVIRDATIARAALDERLQRPA